MRISSLISRSVSLSNQFNKILFSLSVDVLIKIKAVASLISLDGFSKNKYFSSSVWSKYFNVSSLSWANAKVAISLNSGYLLKSWIISNNCIRASSVPNFPNPINASCMIFTSTESMSLITFATTLLNSSIRNGITELSPILPSEDSIVNCIVNTSSLFSTKEFCL